MRRVGLLAGALILSSALVAGRTARGQAVAFQPVIGTVPDGAMMNVTPVVTADRRYVRLGINPIFTNVQGFETFTTGGAVAGGGGGGIGVGGGLPGFGGGLGNGAGGGVPGGGLGAMAMAAPGNGGYGYGVPYGGFGYSGYGYGGYGYGGYGTPYGGYGYGGYGYGYGNYGYTGIIGAGSPGSRTYNNIGGLSNAIRSSAFRKRGR